MPLVQPGWERGVDAESAAWIVCADRVAGVDCSAADAVNAMPGEMSARLRQDLDAVVAGPALRRK